MSIIEEMVNSLPKEGEIEDTENLATEELSGDKVDKNLATEELSGEQTPEPIVDTDEVLPEDTKGKNAAFAKMRVEKKEQEKRANELERRLAEIEGVEKGRKSLQDEIIAAQPKTPEVIPDRYDDPDAYDKYQRDQTMAEFEAKYGEKLQKLEALEQQSKVTQEIQVMNQARTHLTTIEDDYIKVDPSYKEAKEYLVQSISNELKIQHPEATDIQIKDEVARLELESASQFFSKQQNPAQMLRKLADARGFKAGNTKAKGQNSKPVSSFIGKTGVSIRGEEPTIEEGNEMTLKQLMQNQSSLEATLRKAGQ